MQNPSPMINKQKSPKVASLHSLQDPVVTH
jgi:hypothetical protein